YPCPALDTTWARRSACMGVRYQRTRPLAECWGQSHERCLPQVLLRPTRAAVAYGVALPSKSRRMNRRIRNRTSGGVGGGGREAYPLPDSPQTRAAAFVAGPRSSLFVAMRPL